MQDFYFKIQINIASVGANADDMRKQIEQTLWDFFNNKTGFMTDVEVDEIDKREYFSI